MYYFASHAYGASPRLFWDTKEIEEELAALEATVKEAEERLGRTAAALETIEGLSEREGDEAALAAVAARLEEAAEEIEALLDTERERLATLKEEWEDARYLLYGAGRSVI